MEGRRRCGPKFREPHMATPAQEGAGASARVAITKHNLDLDLDAVIAAIHRANRYHECARPG